MPITDMSLATPPNARLHVIIGDGITALAFLDACSAQTAYQIVVLGADASELGRGAAYSKGAADAPWRYAYLLNSPADDIDPRFAQWLSDNWSMVAETMAGRAPDWLGAAAPLLESGDIYGVNAPREFYGDFMVAQAEEIIARLAAEGVQVTTQNDTVTQLSPQGDGVLITTASGQTLLAQSVDVAPGGPSTMRIEGDEGPFSAPSVFGYEAQIAEHVRAGAEIFCIGGNAAMLDVLRLCQSLIPETELKFVACAPDGEVPAALVPRLPRKLTQPKLSAGHRTAESFLEEVAREIAQAKRNGDEMREIRAGFRAHFLANPLSTYLSDPAEARKVPGKLRFWLRGGTRDTIFDMHRLIEAGHVRVVQGHTRRVEAQETGADVIVTDASGQETRHRTGFVINCAGAGPNSRFDPLTEDMLEKGLLERSGRGTSLKVGAGCRAGADNIRYLSPAVSEIGDEVIAMPLYDAHMLRTYVTRAQAYDGQASQASVPQEAAAQDV